MTATYSDQTQPANAGILGGFARWIGVLANTLAAHYVRREAIRALRQMDDRQLHDIGLSRSHIEAAVDGALNPEMGRLR